MSRTLARSDGYATLTAVVLIFLLSAVLSALAIRQAQAALAARARALDNLNRAELQTKELGFEALLEELGSRLKPIFDRALRNASGDGTSALTQTLSQAQMEADRLFCPQGITLWLTPRACGKDVPEPLSPVRLLSGKGGVELYEVPFQAELSAKRNEYRASRKLSGVFRVLAGRSGATYSDFALVMGTGYAPDGSPSYLSGGEVYEGPVWIPGVPNFGVSYAGMGRGPVFLGPVAVGLCKVFGTTGCRLPGLPTFEGVGAIPPEGLYPSPLNPCYSTSCPEFGGGVSWHGLDVEPSFAPSAQAPAVFQGDHSLKLSPNPSLGLAEITVDGDPVHLGADGKRLWVIADAGENLLEHALSTPGAFSAYARPSGNAILVYNRDGYYGDAFPVQRGMRFLVRFRVDTREANFPVQIGFRFYRNGSWSNWCGTYYKCTPDQERLYIPPGRPPDQEYSMFLTMPSGAQYAQIWFQIDDNLPWSGNTGRAWFYDVQVIPWDIVIASPIFPWLPPITTPLPGPVALPLWNSPFYRLLSARPNLILVNGRLYLYGAGENQASLVKGTSLTLYADEIQPRSSVFYENPPCENGPGINLQGQVTASRCSAYDSGNYSDTGVLGLLADRFILPKEAPVNLRLTAAVAARRVGYERGAGRKGEFYLLGSLATFHYGGFGDRNGEEGWRFRLSHDPRFRYGVNGTRIAPPGFPTLPAGVYGVAPLITHRAE